jgi:hypothetical protein
MTLISGIHFPMNREEPVKHPSTCESKTHNSDVNQSLGRPLHQTTDSDSGSQPASHSPYRVNQTDHS